MDLKKKKEKEKNLERQALEARRSKSRQRGEPEEESPDEDDGGDGDDDSDDSEGMASTKGETGRGSTSPGAGQAGDAEPRLVPVREGPGASTRGGPRPVGRGTGRRVALPVG